MLVSRLVFVAFIVTAVAAAHQTVSFSTEDGGRVCADLYGAGTRVVVLAHGGRFTKESWHEQADVLAANGFQVLAIDFRGFGCSSGPGEKDFDHAPFENDVLAAVHYLKTRGAKTVSVVGGSFGAAAAGDASIKSGSSDIDRIVFLGGAPNLSAEKLKSHSLFIVTGLPRRGLQNWGIWARKRPENRLLDLFAPELFSAASREQLMNELRVRAERFYREAILEEIIQAERLIESLLQARGLLPQCALSQIH